MSNYIRNRSWDYFTDYCTENGLDIETEDFDAWLEQADMAEEDRWEDSWRD